MLWTKNTPKYSHRACKPPELHVLREFRAKCISGELSLYFISFLSFLLLFLFFLFLPPLILLLLSFHALPYCFSFLSFRSPSDYPLAFFLLAWHNDKVFSKFWKVRNSIKWPSKELLCICVSVCLHACVLTMHMPYLCRAEEEIGSPAIGVINRGS